ncbi:hypothetical protein O6H91_Y129500 [Diphasiastrum complanatum]|nr:hypothetical protein O6H91_Y269900 [Diphasiastrum complanatum]KAJ7296349.1 hypothetical protein O6H91_Y129500 [Diphasiastrum complanatum]
MVHNGIEYGDMQLISEAYDVLISVGGLTNEELHEAFLEWNRSELESFLIEITADIFSVKDDKGEGYLVDKILDKTGMKGTGKWTVQQAAELSVAAPTIAASLDSRFLSGLKEERLAAASIFREAGVGDILKNESVNKKQLMRCFLAGSKTRSTTYFNYSLQLFRLACSLQPCLACTEDDKEMREEGIMFVEKGGM